MTTRIHAAVTHSKDGGIRIEELLIDDPGPGEVLVRVRASGICHTDLLAPQIVALPAVFGHESTGDVIAVGEGVQAVRPGDRVVGCYGYCGHCIQCRRGAPFHCKDFSTIQLGSRRGDSPALRRPDGTPISASFFEQSGFATHALMTERNVVRVPEGALPEHLAPLGCGMLTGYGGVSQAFAPAPGSSLVVIGAGGVGLPALMAARAAGCDPIIAVDTLPARLELACEVGASHTFAAGVEDLGAAVRGVIGDGADFVLATVGEAAVFNSMIDLARPGGTCGFVAVPNLGQPFELCNGRALLSLNLVGIIEGRAEPHLMIRDLATRIGAGELPMDSYTTVFEFDDIARALQAAKAGEVAKAVLRMPADG